MKILLNGTDVVKVDTEERDTREGRGVTWISCIDIHCRNLSCDNCIVTLKGYDPGEFGDNIRIGISKLRELNIIVEE